MIKKAAYFRRQARREKAQRAAQERWRRFHERLAQIEPVRDPQPLPPGEFLLLLPDGQRWHYSLEADPRDGRLLRVRDAATGAAVMRSGLEPLWRHVQRERIKPEGYSRSE